MFPKYILHKNIQFKNVFLGMCSHIFSLKIVHSNGLHVFMFSLHTKSIFTVFIGWMSNADINKTHHIVTG